MAQEAPLRSKIPTTGPRRRPSCRAGRTEIPAAGSGAADGRYGARRIGSVPCGDAVRRGSAHGPGTRGEAFPRTAPLTRSPRRLDGRPDHLRVMMRFRHPEACRDSAAPAADTGSGLARHQGGNRTRSVRKIFSPNGPGVCFPADRTLSLSWCWCRRAGPRRRRLGRRRGRRSRLRWPGRRGGARRGPGRPARAGRRR